MFLDPREHTQLLDPTVPKQEHWKGIEDLDHIYEVSTYGKVRNSRTGREITLQHNPNGYVYACLLYTSPSPRD